jgi:pimeloyl-ACP methyl ester carboxylesterase
MTAAVNEAIRAYLDGLQGEDYPVRLSWEQWLTVTPPYPVTGFSQKEVTKRYARNGYEWDIHGSLYTPEKDVDPSLAFVFFHGGADSESVFDLTPDSRPGVARVLAGQGYTVLTISYPGHYPPGNRWRVPIKERQPLYLLDRDLSLEETLDRNLKCTFNTILQGAGELALENLAGRDIITWGHSTGGSMAAALCRFTRLKVIGLANFGTGGPDGWRKEWRESTGAERYVELPVDRVSRRSPATYREAGYEDPPDLTPWGGSEQLFTWAASAHRSQIKTSLCDNQHRAIVPMLEQYPARTGLPLQEYVDHLESPNPDWLKTVSVLALVGENDKGHWVCGGAEVADKREIYMARRYRNAGVVRNHVVLIPRYGHFGFMELHNEKFVYLWLWALKHGYFGKRG